MAVMLPYRTVLAASSSALSGWRARAARVGLPQASILQQGAADLASLSTM